jgi:GINS complex subunit 4
MIDLTSIEKTSLLNSKKTSVYDSHFEENFQNITESSNKYSNTNSTEIMGIKDTLIMNKTYNKLILEWQKEKFSDELLQYKDTLVNQVSDLIDKSLKQINTTLADENQFLKEIMELDLERLVFVLKDYLRIRIAKIEKFLYFIIKNDLSGLLSSNEFEYAFNLFKLKRAYFNQILYKKIAPDLSEFKNSISNKVVVSPNVNNYTFVKCLSHESITLSLKNVFETIEEGYIEMIKGDIYCLPERLIKDGCDINQFCFI